MNEWMHKFPWLDLIWNVLFSFSVFTVHCPVSYGWRSRRGNQGHNQLEQQLDIMWPQGSQSVAKKSAPPSLCTGSSKVVHFFSLFFFLSDFLHCPETGPLMESLNIHKLQGKKRNVLSESPIEVLGQDFLHFHRNNSYFFRQKIFDWLKALFSLL